LLTAIFAAGTITIISFYLLFSCEYCIIIRVN